jgi:hypothetical protein
LKLAGGGEGVPDKCRRVLESGRKGTFAFVLFSGPVSSKIPLRQYPCTAIGRFRVLDASRSPVKSRPLVPHHDAGRPARHDSMRDVIDQECLVLLSRRGWKYIDVAIYHLFKTALETTL